jgi:hypothetical protein
MGDGSLPLARRLRIAAVALIVAWFFLPDLQRAVPLWIPFLAAAALELHFLVAGLRERGSGRVARGRSPQATDIADFGGEEWLQPVLIEVDGQELWVPAAGKSDEEVLQLIEEQREAMRSREPGEPVPEPPLPELPVARARPRRLLARLEGVAVLGALALVLLVLVPDGGWRDLDRADQEKAEARFSTEAAAIAGHRARIHCDAEGEAVGIVQHAEGVAQVGGTDAYLTPDICFRLYRLAFEDDEGAFSQTARAIAVLAHEAWHLRGVRDEGITNCYAFQSGVVLGQRLGLSEGTAARMMRQQLADNATYARGAPTYLVPGECRDGGSLDLTRGSSRFP